MEEKNIELLKAEYAKAKEAAIASSERYIELVQPYVETRIIDGVETPWFEPSKITDKEVIDAINLESANGLKKDINCLILEGEMVKAGLIEPQTYAMGCDLEGRINWAETGYVNTFIKGGNWEKPLPIDVFPMINAEVATQTQESKYHPIILGTERKDIDVKNMSLREQAALYTDTLDKDLKLKQGMHR